MHLKLHLGNVTMSLPTYQSIADRAAAAGLELKQLCAEAGIAASTLWRWKSGKTDPLKTVRNIEDVLRKHEGR
jgi:transcriptional regulator with XRE-family HTH domain